MNRIRSLARKLTGNESGVAAVEFSLIAPILCIACVTTADLGMAVTERMTIDHVLRTGAESAMQDSGEEEVRDVMEAIAGSNFALAGQGGSTTDAYPITVDAERFCTCPDAADTEVDCATQCTDSAPVYVYYRLSAAKTYPGLIIPDISFDASLQVQTQ